MTHAEEHLHPTPLGPLRLRGTPDGLQSVGFADADAPAGGPAPEALRECARQLDEYFAGARRAFTLPLAPEGTDFQRRVWSALARIPYGETATYLDVATALGDPKAVRAVGAANGRNPLAVLVPCHRVVGQGGSLTGYAAGLERKAWLLRHERRVRASDGILAADPRR